MKHDQSKHLDECWFRLVNKTMNYAVLLIAVFLLVNAVYLLTR